jgi:hypothetical protein
VVKFNNNKIKKGFITDTTKKLLNLLIEFLDIIASIVSTNIYQTAIKVISFSIEEFLISLFRFSQEVSLSDKQFFSLISNSNFIITSLIPYIYKRLIDMFSRRELPEVKKFFFIFNKYK